MAFLYSSSLLGKIQFYWLWNFLLSVYSTAMKSFAASSSNGSSKIGKKIALKLNTGISVATTSHQPALRPQTQLILPSKPTAPTGNATSNSSSHLSISSFTRFFSQSNQILRKQLVLDLDETLIYSYTERSWFNSYHIKVEDRKTLGSSTFYVKKRPHVDHFLKTVSQWFEVSIFTASIKPYANPIIDHLDPDRTLISRRYYRDSTTPDKHGSFVKDLRKICKDLSKVLIIDNAPISFSMHKENGIHIKDWLGVESEKDEALLQLLPLLESIKDSDMDVRESLKLFSNGNNDNRKPINVIIR